MKREAAWRLTTNPRKIGLSLFASVILGLAGAFTAGALWGADFAVFDTALVPETAATQTAPAPPRALIDATPTATAPANAVPSATPTATATDTPAPTETPVPPTPTPEPPTATPVLPTATPEPPTETPVPPTATLPPPTATPVPPAPTLVPPTPTTFVGLAPGAATAPQPPAAALTGLEADMLAQHNANRGAAGLAPLQIDGALVAIARQRAQDMAARNYFSHTSPTGETAFSLMDAYGYRYALAGENIARNNYPQSESVDVAMNGLMNSPGHRANILEPAFTKVGIGVATDGNGMIYYAVVFAG